MSASETCSITNIAIHVHAAGFEGAIVTTVLVPEVEDALGFDFKLCW